jgi:hypothetical protein
VLLPNVRIVPSVAAVEGEGFERAWLAFHALEHLASSDQGVIRLRRMLRRAIDAVRRGEDPRGILRDSTPNANFSSASRLIPKSSRGSRSFAACGSL